MCIWSIKLGQVDNVLGGVHIVQGKEYFTHFKNPY